MLIGSQFSNGELFRLFDRLQVLFTAGLPLLAAVQFIADNDEGTLSEVMSEIAQKLSSGYTLSAGFASHPKLFPAVVPAMISVAEKSGSLDIALSRLALYFKRAERLQSQLMGGILYPAGILLTALGMVGVLVFVVFPKEQQVLAEMGKPMPYLSLLAVHSIQLSVVLMVLAVVALFFINLQANQRLRRGERQLRLSLDRLALGIPVVGKVLARAAAARMLSVLAGMLEVGVNLTQTEAVASLAGNEEIAERYRGFLRQIRKGGELDEALEQNSPFPKVSTQIFLLGYEHGKMVHSLRNAAEMLESEVENTLATFVALLEPIAMMLVGTVVGILVIATALPTLSLLQQL
ncbi:MAG: type II secretion system F family protein [Vulcanimicrobiota bacterium]